MRDYKKYLKQIPTGVTVLLLLLAFVLGNRLNAAGDWFFNPYNNSDNQKLSGNLNIDSTQAVYDLLRQKYDGTLDATQLEDGLKEGLVAATGDPYTSYLSKEEAEEFRNELSGNFSGIGAELGKRDNNLVIIAPLDGSPAAKAGLLPGDRISSIDGEDTTDTSVEAAVNKIRGEAGSVVKLGVISNDQPREVQITRAAINVPSVTSEVTNGIGYLKISRFSDDTAGLAAQAAADFKAKNVRGVVVDVRNNGGGLLQSAVDIAGLWLENKVVVEERQNNKVRQVLRTKRNAPLSGIKSIVLVNEGSASASEILAGALRDNGAATLLGAKTFGKGSVQELIELSGGAQLKVTIARWYTPKGVNIDKTGLEPDEKVDLTAEDVTAGRDPQKDRALQELQN